MNTDFMERGFGLDEAVPRTDGMRRVTSALARLLTLARNSYAEWRLLRGRRLVLHGLSDHMLRDIGLSEVEIDALRASDPYPSLSPDRCGRLVAR